MNLERAIEIAVEAHKGAKDKGGNPYVLHPLRVMLSLRTDEERMVGVLHDVVEDSEWTFQQLVAEGFSEIVINGLKSVTKITDDEDYSEFVKRAKSNPIGLRVKIADITDNLDITRIDSIRQKDIDRITKYKAALALLNE